ncbi:MAG TPA: NTP transferase domain-containing protein [Opitutaceae bacterium]|nr:NTP transferase domain-containing protein [Opitutaceae bacterium]
MIAPAAKRYVIVQAGGKGSRLEHFCWNKPKCLVPVNGAPLLYSLLERFPDSTEFIVIGNHRQDVLARVLETFTPPRRVTLVKGSSAGTIDGLAEAVRELPSDTTPFLFVWSDIYFEEPPDAILSAPDNVVTVGVTHSFTCRWQLDAHGHFEERHGTAEGVFGLFKIPNRTWVRGLPAAGGEFVRWLAESGHPVRREYFDRIKEYGTLEALHSCWAEGSYCRFFNEVQIDGNRVTKRAKLASHADMIRDELGWYDFVQERRYAHVPQVLQHEPMVLSRVDGRHPFDLPGNFKHRQTVVENIMAALEELHHLVPPAAPDLDDTRAVYHEKTLQRLRNVARLVPEYTERPYLVINGYKCRNPLHADHAAWFSRCCELLSPQAFTVIHGDPTFSNTLVQDDLAVRFIDPRGRFGKTKIFGDPLYDWAKLYYSLVGGYDQFNRRQFLLCLDDDQVEVSVRNSGWSHLAGVFESRFKPEERSKIRLLHALIWLSLSGYVTDDYDSILGAYFKGVLELELAAA